MANLMQDVNFLRFFHTTQASTRDKDILKNEAFAQYNSTVNGLMAPVAIL